MPNNFLTSIINNYWKRLIILFALIILMMLWHNFIHPWMLDDAFISFRYAENWANGLGPVYNVGEKVEGYTTFLWVAILALGNKVGFETIALAKILSYHTAFFTLGILIFLNKIILKIKKEVGVIAALVTGTSGIFLPWPVSGMETSLFTLLLLLSVVSYLFSINQEINRKNLLITSLSLTLLTLTRPEGVLITGILFIHYVLKYRNDWTWLILPFVTIYGGYFAWRAMYYQSFLPNTFYAKSGNMLFQIFRGIRYTNRFVLASACILVPALLWIMDRSFNRAKHLRIPLLGAIVLVYVSYIILVGGDIMPAFRFFVPILPIISLLAASAFVYIFKDTRIVILATVIMVSYNFFQIASHHELNAIYFEDNVVKEGKIVGTWLKENFPADTVIATNTAGSIPYYSKFTTIDMLGLTDTHIARSESDPLDIWYAGHGKGDGKYILEKKPNIVFFRSGLGAQEPYFKSDRELFELKEFRQIYTYQEVAINPNIIIKFYARH